MSDDGNPDISDYSIFVKGEIGRTATDERYGYSFGMTVVSPLSNEYRDLLGSQDSEEGSFPNEWAGLLPEFKLQLPTVMPIDIAVDLRLMTYRPERGALLTSYEVTRYMTFYQSISYTTAIGGLWSVGSEVSLGNRVSLYVEYSRWLQAHDYPNAYPGPVPEFPYSVGVGFSYHWIKPLVEYDPRHLAGALTGDSQ